MKRSAQSTVEFLFVFLMLIGLFFCLIELSLYWKARYSVETVANELIARAQLAPLSNDPAICPAADVAIETLKNRGWLFLFEGADFTKNVSDGVFTYTSKEALNDRPRLSLTVNCKDIKDNKLSLLLAYRYHGMFLYIKETDIFSSQNWQSPKF